MSDLSLNQNEQAREAERAVLGGLMLETHRFDTVIQVIKENDFYRLADLGEFPVDERPSDISSGDLYLQLCYCYQNLEQIKEKNISISKFENFKKDEILSTVKSLIQIKSILGQFDDEMVRLNSLLESEI